MDLFIMAAILFLSGAGLIVLGRANYKAAQDNIPKDYALFYACVSGAMYAVAVGCYLAGAFTFYLACGS